MNILLIHTLLTLFSHVSCDRFNKWGVKHHQVGEKKSHFDASLSDVSRFIDYQLGERTGDERHR